MEERNNTRCVRDQIRCMYFEDSFLQEEINSTSVDENKGFFSKLFRQQK